MIDWGDIPAGSVASIYWPQVAGLRRRRARERAVRHATRSRATEVNASGARSPAASATSRSRRARATTSPGLLTRRSPADGGHRAGIQRPRPARLHALGARHHPPDPDPPPSDRRGHRSPRVGRARGRTEGGRRSSRGRRPTDSWRYVVGTFAVSIPVATARDDAVPRGEHAGHHEVAAATRWRPRTAGTRCSSATSR